MHDTILQELHNQSIPSLQTDLFTKLGEGSRTREIDCSVVDTIPSGTDSHYPSRMIRKPFSTMQREPTKQLSEHLTSQATRRPHRKKMFSSLKDMLEEKPDDLKSIDSFDLIEKMKYSSEELKSLRLMSRRLRQTKRKLLLKCVETPVEPVDKLRDILLKISVDSPSDEFSTSATPLPNEGE